MKIHVLNALREALYILKEIETLDSPRKLDVELTLQAVRPGFYSSRLTDPIS